MRNAAANAGTLHSLTCHSALRARNGTGYYLPPRDAPIAQEEHKVVPIQDELFARKRASKTPD